MVSPPVPHEDALAQMPVCSSFSVPPSRAPSEKAFNSRRPSLEDEKQCSTPPEHVVQIPEDKTDLIVTWDDSDKHENPRSWKTSHRLLMVIVVSLYSLQSPMTSSMTAPALDVMMDQFHVTSSTVGNMMMSIQVLAFAVGPIVFAPMSEKFGRKNVIQLMNLMYVGATHTAF